MTDSFAPWNFKWIQRNELAIMGYPKNEENVRYLVDRGIKHLVSLSPEKQPPFEHFPLKNWTWTPIDVLEFQPPSLSQIVSFINLCYAARAHKEAVGVHCRMGRGRSGVMAACFLVRFYDMRPEYACTAVRLAQPGAIETYSQERAVHGYYDYIRKDDKEHEPIDEVDLYIKSIPRPHWDWKPRRKLIFDPDY